MAKKKIKTVINNIKTENMVNMIEETFSSVNPAEYLYFYGSCPNVLFEIVKILQEFTNESNTEMEGTLHVVAVDKITNEVIGCFLIYYTANVRKVGVEYEVSNIKITSKKESSPLLDYISGSILNICLEDKIKYLFDSDFKMMCAIGQ